MIIRPSTTWRVIVLQNQPQPSFLTANVVLSLALSAFFLALILCAG